MENQKGLTHTRHSEISTISNRINDPEQHKAIIGDLSLSIRKAIDSPSFNQLKASGANVKETTQVLAVLILKYANMLTVGGNLRPEHPMQYAESMIQDNPTMSLDDFNILLSNGVKGKYNEAGKLFRLDIAVIYDWIRAYQEEFWEVKENLPKQKTALEMLPDDKLNEIQEVIAKADGVRPVRSLTHEEVMREGKAKLVKHLGKDMTIEEYENYLKYKKQNEKPVTADSKEMIDLKAEYGRTCRHLHTGAVLPGKPETFEDFLKTIEI